MVNRTRYSVMTHDIDMKEIVKAGYFDKDVSYYDKLQKIVEASKKESPAGIEIPNDRIRALVKPVPEERQIVLSELIKLKNALKKQINTLEKIGGNSIAEIVRQYKDLSFNSKITPESYQLDKEFELEAVETLISFIKSQSSKRDIPYFLIGKTVELYDHYCLNVLKQKKLFKAPKQLKSLITELTGIEEPACHINESRKKLKNI